MRLLSQIAAVTFVLVLAVGVPILSFITARDPRLRLVPRLSLYFSAVISQWLLAAVCVLVVLAGRGSFLGLGLRGVGLRALAWWTILVLAAAAFGMILLMLLESLRLWPKESELVYLLLPRTRREKLWATLAVAPTAALCEEFLYRGFLFRKLASWTHSLFWAALVAAVVFGLAHMYQRWSGMARAAALGLLLTYPVIRLGTLFPSMIAHFLLDAASLAWLGPALLRDEQKAHEEADDGAPAAEPAEGGGPP